MMNEPAIVKRNRDTEHAMHACCNWGLFEQTKRKNKLLALLVTTDIHESPAQLTSAVDYLNYYDALDAGVCLGDIQASNFAKTDGSWYLNAIAHTQKPFMSIIGNHDVGNSFDPAISASAQKAYEKFIRPTDPFSGIEGRETPYFVKLFDEYKVALIGLDLYGDPSAVLENGKYAVQRGTHTLPQKEIDWLAKALAAIPVGYHLLLGMHSFPYDAEVTEGAWTQRGARLFYPSECPYGDDNLIPDMIDAWVKGGKLRAEYPPLDPAHLPTLTADCDFTARGAGIFAGYLVGHYHRDIQGTCKKYPYQNIIAFPATANDGWQNYCSDLPREKGTRAEDALTVVGVDTYNRRLKLVRIGSNITMDMTERKYHVVEY